MQIFLIQDEIEEAVRIMIKEKLDGDDFTISEVQFTLGNQELDEGLQVTAIIRKKESK